MPPLLGCIADDFTGATDLAGMLVKHGMKTLQMIGLPSAARPGNSDAIVIALKTRTAPQAEAVKLSLDALKWLRKAGCRQFYFKYCSTFDSTDQGNIGPVIEALMDALDIGFTIACPAFPANGRTVFHGYLHVGDLLLHESGMRNHPLTPMTDSNLVRVLQRQTKRKVGLVHHESVQLGVTEIECAFQHCRGEGVEVAIVDAICDSDLRKLGAACKDMRLVTGGSGLSMGLVDNLRAQGVLSVRCVKDRLPRIEGLSAVISGSCSPSTLRQIELMKEQAPAFEVDPMQLSVGATVIAEAVRWACARLPQGPVLIYSSADRTAQREFGSARTSALVENALAVIASKLVDYGVRRLIIAGGETAAAVVTALGVSGLEIGEEIDPGVPWTVSLGERPLALALKSGNFGGPDFFLKALSQLP